MNKILISVMLLVAIATGIYYFNQPQIKESEQHDVSVSYRSQSHTITLPDGQTADYALDVPFIVESSNETPVFSESFIQEAFGPTVEQAVISPSGNYIFLAVSNKRDSFIRPYVYDVVDGSIHLDCLSGVMNEWGYACNDLYGVISNDASIKVDWTIDDTLTFTVSSPSQSESYTHRSIERGEPWQTVLIN